MKNNIEKSIKESLKDFEMPYNAKAWESMSKTLDQSMPISGKTNWKWYLGGVAIVAITLITFYKLSNNKSANSAIISHKFNSIDSSQKNNSTESQKQITKNSPSSEVATFKNLNLESNGSIVTSGNSDSGADASGAALLNEVNKSNQQNSNNSGGHSNEKNNDNFSSTKKVISFPAIQDVCQGEIIVIKNDNDADIFLTNNGKTYPISANNKFNFNAENAGSYFFGYTENGAITYSKTPSFKVKPTPSSDFTIDDRDKYENGVPTIKMIVNSEELANYSWKIEGLKSDLSGKEVKAHLFNKGNHSVTLTSTPHDGSCPSKVSKNIQVDDDYNLMAVNSFWPQSNDPRNATFMPYALKERTTDFTMLIIDPSNGATLFETSDPTNSWAGINKGNGQLVDVNKVFIWIVRLKNPLPGEKSEYKGTIVRL